MRKRARQYLTIFRYGSKLMDDPEVLYFHLTSSEGRGERHRNQSAQPILHWKAVQTRSSETAIQASSIFPDARHIIWLQRIIRFSLTQKTKLCPRVSGELETADQDRVGNKVKYLSVSPAYILLYDCRRGMESVHIGNHSVHYRNSTIDDRMPIFSGSEVRHLCQMCFGRGFSNILKRDLAAVRLHRA